MPVAPCLAKAEFWGTRHGDIWMVFNPFYTNGLFCPV